MAVCLIQQSLETDWVIHSMCEAYPSCRNKEHGEESHLQLDLTRHMLTVDCNRVDPYGVIHPVYTAYSHFKYIRIP